MPQSAAVAELAPISALRAERAHAAMPAPLDPFDEQGPRRHGVRKQVLGASFHLPNTLPRQARIQIIRHRPAQAGIAHQHPLHSLALQVGLNAPAGGFDFG